VDYRYQSILRIFAIVAIAGVSMVFLCLPCHAARKVETIGEYKAALETIGRLGNLKAIMEFVEANPELTEKALDEYWSLPQDSPERKETWAIFASVVNSIYSLEDNFDDYLGFLERVPEDWQPERLKEYLVVNRKFVTQQVKSLRELADQQPEDREEFLRYADQLESVLREHDEKKEAESTGKEACEDKLTQGYMGNDGKYFQYAISMFEQARECFLEISGGQETADTARPLIGLGSTYFARADYDAAIENFQDALRIQLDVLGKDDPALATTYMGIANVHYIQGRYSEALDYYNSALAIRERNPEEPESYQKVKIAKTYTGIGNVERDLDDYDTALRHYRIALEMDLDAFGEEFSGLATDYLNIGFTYHLMGRYRKSLEEYEKALEVSLDMLGSDHATTAQCYHNMGIAYRALLDNTRALEYFRKALDIRLRIFGTKHPRVAYSYQDIAGVYTLAGDYEVAIDYYMKARDILVSVFGDSNPEVADLYEDMGWVYVNRGSPGDYTMAFEYFTRAKDILEKVKGKDSLDVAKYYENMGKIFFNLDNFKLALDFYVKALDISEKIFTGPNPITARLHNQAGAALLWMGEYDRALEHLEKSLEINLEIMGPEHPQLSGNYHNIALYHQFKGDNETALEYYLHALDLCCGKAMDVDPQECISGFQPLRTSKALADMFYDLGRSGKAVEMYSLSEKLLERLRGGVETGESRKLLVSRYFDVFPRGIRAYLAMAESSGEKNG